MRFLIIAPYFFPYQNPRAKRIAVFLEALDKEGFKADIISSATAIKLASYSENIRVYAKGYNSTKEYLFKSNNSINPNSKNLDSSKSNSPKIKRLAKSFNELFVKSLYWPDDAFMWIPTAKKVAHKLCEEHRYDFMLSFSLPFSAQLVAESIKDKYPHLKWITDIGDPLSFQQHSPINNPLLYKKKNKRAETRILKKANLNIITNIGQKKLYMNAYKIKASKLSVVGPLQTGYIITGKKEIKHKISILYIGSFYKKLRSPKLIIKPFEALLKKYPEYKSILQLNIAGNLDTDQIQLFRSSPELNGICSILPFQDQKEMEKLLYQSDFVINLGNRSNHQLPSKCTDYIRSRRPIINIIQSEEDPSKRFFQEYPLLLNLSFYESAKTQSNQLKSFIDEHKVDLVNTALAQKLLSKHSGRYLLDTILSV